MDIDVFPNSLEYWGPAGMVFFRNVQVRWMPIQGDTRLTIALERPGASAEAAPTAQAASMDAEAGQAEATAPQPLAIAAENHPEGAAPETAPPPADIELPRDAKAS